MAEGSRWTPGKIFLVVICAVVGLGLLCCGGIYAFLGPEIKSGYHLVVNSKAFVDALQQDYGASSAFEVVPNDRKELVLAIGVGGDLTPERVREVQDGAWKTLGRVYGEDGFFPVKYVAVGRSVGGGDGGGVIDWSKNMVETEELVRRTGVPAPPLVAFLPSGAFDKHIRVEVSDDGPPPTKKDDAKDKEGGGAGDGGK